MVKQRKSDNLPKENIKTHNSHWQQNLDHQDRISIIGDSGSRKTNVLIYLINHEQYIDKTYSYVKDLYES